MCLVPSLFTIVGFCVLIPWSCISFSHRLRLEQCGRRESHASEIPSSTRPCRCQQTNTTSYETHDTSATTPSTPPHRQPATPMPKRRSRFDIRHLLALALHAPLHRPSRMQRRTETKDDHVHKRDNSVIRRSHSLCDSMYRQSNRFQKIFGCGA